MPVSDVLVVQWAPTSDPFDTSPTWATLTTSVQSVQVSRGRSGPFELFGEGRATIVVKNTDASIDPTQWYRWRQVRILANPSGLIFHTIFYGFVQQIFHDQGRAPDFATATIEAADIFSILHRHEFGGTSVPEELSGARVDRLVDDANVPAAWQSIDTGFHFVTEPVGQLFGEEAAGLLNVNTLQHLQDVSEVEQAGLYVDRSGVVTFEDRYTLRDRLAGSADITFSDTASGSQVPYLYGNLTLTPPGTDYRNSITFIGDSGDAQTAENVPTNYPTDSMSRTVPMVRDTQAKANAEMLLDAFRQETVTWPTEVSVLLWPDSQTALDEVPQIDLRRYAIVEFTPAGTSQQTYNVVIERIEHRITPGRWEATIGFSSGDRWIDAWITGVTFLKLNDATEGQLDQEELAF